MAREIKCSHIAGIKTIVKAESGQRGFLLTEDVSYLAPFNSGTKEAKIQLKRLKKLTSDNSNQQ